MSDRESLLARYRADGRVLLPIPAGTKKATIPAWSDPATTLFEVAETDNVAWRLDGLVDVDLDHPLARTLAPWFLPSCDSLSGRPSAGAGHWFYQCDALAYEKIGLPGMGTILEVRTGPGHYTVVPPSMLPPARGLPGEAAAWIRDGPLTSPDPLVLARGVKLLVTAVGLAHALGKWGFGHDARLDVAGFLLRLGLTPEEATTFGEAISGPTDNDDVTDVAVSVKSTAIRLAKDETRVSGGPSLARRIGDNGPELIKAISALFGQFESAGCAWTESGDAETFAALHGDSVRYDHRRGRWLTFKGHSWKPQTDGEVDRLSLLVVRHRQKEAQSTENPDQKAARVLWALKGESRSRRVNLMALAQSVKPISDKGDMWDKDPWLLGCPNGVVDLRTGELRPGRPEDRITMQAAFPFDPHAKAPLWEATIAAVFDNDPAIIAYFQRAMGYSTTGATKEEVLFVCHGNGSNGKGTLMNTVGKVLGDYSDDLPFSTFEQRGGSSGIPNDIAKIDGKRFVTSAETSTTGGVKLNEERIKAMTGRDPITARFLRQEFFTFEPLAKIWFAANQRPEIRDDSDGLWRRLHLVPFLQSFGKEKANLDLKDLLLLEGPGILRWLVEGALEWQRLGLAPPQSVLAGTEAWKEESDPLSDFLLEACVEAPEARVGATVLYEEYRRWAARGGTREPFSQKAFGTRMRKKHQVEEGRHVRYVGIGLRADDNFGEGKGDRL